MDKRLLFSAFLTLTLSMLSYPAIEQSEPRYRLNFNDQESIESVGDTSNRVFYTFTPRAGLVYEVRVPVTRENEISDILNQLMATHLQVEKLLGKTGLAVTVSLLPTTVFYQLTGAPNWVNAMYYKNTILIPISAATDISDDSFIRTIRHEYLHAVMDKLAAGGCPGWIEEGLAQLLEGDMQEDLNQYFYRWAGTNGLLSFKQLQRGFTELSDEIAPVAYAQSALAVKMLIDRYGYAALRTYFDSIGSGTPTGEAFQSAFGVDEIYFQDLLQQSLSPLLL